MAYDLYHGIPSQEYLNVILLFDPSDVRKPSHTKMDLVNVAEAGTADAGSGANCGAEDFPPLSFWFLICKVGQ